MKNSIDTIGNRTRDPPTCSAVTQPTVPPRHTKIVMFVVHNSCVCGVGNLAALSNQLFRSAIHWLRTARLPFSGHLLMSCNRAPSSNDERPAGRPSTLYCFMPLSSQAGSVCVCSDCASQTGTYQKLELKVFTVLVISTFPTFPVHKEIVSYVVLSNAVRKQSALFTYRTENRTVCATPNCESVNSLHFIALYCWQRIYIFTVPCIVTLY